MWYLRFESARQAKHRWWRPPGEDSSTEKRYSSYSSSQPLQTLEPGPARRRCTCNPRLGRWTRLQQEPYIELCRKVGAARPTALWKVIGQHSAPTSGAPDQDYCRCANTFRHILAGNSPSTQAEAPPRCCCWGAATTACPGPVQPAHSHDSV